MATTYLEALQVVQPEGPYYLSGWSLGAMVAWEMAQQLQAVGKEVAQVILIDYVPRDVVTSEGIDETSIANSLAADIGDLFGTALPISQSDMDKLQPEEQLNLIYSEAKRLNVLPPEIGMEQMRYLFQVFKANHIALASYQAQEYSGNVALFSASTSAEDEGWKKFVTGKLETYTIPGDHYTMMRSPHVGVLAQELEACLNQVLV